MNTALLDNMNDVEFLRIVKSDVRTDLEGLLFDRLDAVALDRQGKDEETQRLEDYCGELEEDVAEKEMRVDELESEIDDLRGFAKDLLEAIKELSPDHEILERESEFAL